MKQKHFTFGLGVILSFGCSKTSVEADKAVKVHPRARAF